MRLLIQTEYLITLRLMYGEQFKIKAAFLVEERLLDMPIKF